MMCIRSPCGMTSGYCPLCHVSVWPMPIMPILPQPMGCICPAGAEQTCQNPMCARRDPLKRGVTGPA